MTEKNCWKMTLSPVKKYFNNMTISKYPDYYFYPEHGLDVKFLLNLHANRNNIKPNGSYHDFTNCNCLAVEFTNHKICLRFTSTASVLQVLNIS